MVALFDINGTLTDPAGIGEPWDRPDLGLRILRNAVLSAMAGTIAGSYTPLPEHLRDALALEVHAEGLDPSRIDDALARAAALDPWPDAAAALECLRDAGWTIAALTNSGAAGGRQTLERAGLVDRFDHVLGVDAVAAFKPHPSTYAHAARTLDTAPGDITLVAAHAWDVTGAHHAGLRTAWIARGEGVLGRAGAQPDHRATDLLDAARQLIRSTPPT